MSWKFLNVGKCNAAIAELEQKLEKLGRPIGERPKRWNPLNIGMANAEYARLEKLLLGEPSISMTSQRPVAAVNGAPFMPSRPPGGSPTISSPAPPTLSKRDQPPPTSPPPMPAPTPTPARPGVRTPTPMPAGSADLKLLAHLFPSIRLNASSDAADVEVFERTCYQSWVRFPGMRSDKELSQMYEREELVGIGRVVRSIRQARIDAMFGPSVREPAAATFPKATAAAATEGPVISTATPAPASRSGVRPTAKQMHKIADELFPQMQTRDLDDDQLWTSLQRAAFQAHIRLPGMAADSSFEIPRAAKTGQVRIEAALKQKRLAQILK
jgi:hypothetical protein